MKSQREIREGIPVLLFIGFTVTLVLSALGPVPVLGLAREDSILARPVVIGASLSAGLSAGKDLSQVLEAKFGRERGSIETACSVLFWRDPVETGTLQAKFALQREPTVLIAIDFLFWFGYGDRNLDGNPIASGSERLDLLRHGLGLLEPFSCPIFLADFPRDRGRVARMISSAHAPSSETIRDLNRELLRWSAGRSNVIVLPLSSKLEEVWDSEEAFAGDGMAGNLLQSDGVHPTLAGLDWISQRVAAEMVDRGWFESFEVEQNMASIPDDFRNGDPLSDGTTTRLQVPRAGHLEGG